LSTPEKRALIGQLKGQYAVTDLCTWLDCPRSSYYAPSVKADEGEVVAAIEQILLRFPC
jgi:hypothetical protein